MILCNQIYAHWIFATHEFMIDPLAINALNHVGKSAYVNLLDRGVFINGKKKKFIDFIIQGVRDADLRANGIYAVDGKCKDPTKEDCNEKERIYNDIAEWPIGDHGYNNDSGYGFYSNPLDDLLSNRINELLLNFYDPKVEKLRKVLGCVREDREAFKGKIEEVAQDSNAATMARYYWEKALSEWEKGITSDAMYNLGIAIHLVQDMTVPYHSKLIRNQINENHNEYEKYIWESYLKKGTFKPGLKGTDLWAATPNEQIKSNAYQSCKLNLDPKISAIESVEMGIESTAKVIIAFFDSAFPIADLEKNKLSQVVRSIGQVSYHSPNWSQDGQKIVFNSEYSEKVTYKSDKGELGTYDQRRGDIYSISPSGSNIRMLSSKKGRLDRGPIWSASGDFIAFSRMFSNGINDKGEQVSCEIHCPRTLYVMRSDGSNQREIVSNDGLYNYCWSPDGKRVLFTGGYKETEGLGVPRLWIANVDGTNITKISDEESTGGGILGVFLSPCWSPNGLNIAYIRQEPSPTSFAPPKFKLIVINLNNNKRNEYDLSEIIKDSFFNLKIIDNHKVAVPIENNKLKIVPLEKTMNSTIINLGEGNHHTWSYNSSKILFVNQGNIWIMNNDSTEKMQLTTSGLFSNALNFTASPSKEKIAFERDGSIWVLDLTNITEDNNSALIESIKELMKTSI